MYAEFATDVKVQMMGEADQRRLVMLFCLRCNDNVTLHVNKKVMLKDEEISFQLRISNEEWQETKRLFISKGFIDSDNNLLNWDKRQYTSDSSAERVAKHRRKKKDAKNAPVTTGNVTVTPPDTDTDTDTEITTATSVAVCAEPDGAPPKVSKKPIDDSPVFIELPLNVKNTFHPVTEKSIAHWQELYPAVDVQQELRGMLGWLEANPTKRKTKGGIASFVTRWLSNQQNNSRPAVSSTAARVRQPPATRPNYQYPAAKANGGVIDSTAERVDET